MSHSTDHAQADTRRRWTVPGDAGLAAALEALQGPAAMARLLNVTHSAVAQWRRIPPHHVLSVARATGIPAQKLRPDLYPADG